MLVEHVMFACDVTESKKSLEHDDVLTESVHVCVSRFCSKRNRVIVGRSFRFVNGVSGSVFYIRVENTHPPFFGTKYAPLKSKSCTQKILYLCACIRNLIMCVCIKAYFL